MKFKMNVQKFIPLLGIAFLSSCYQQELTPDTVKASAAKTEAVDYSLVTKVLAKYPSGSNSPKALVTDGAPTDCANESVTDAKTKITTSYSDEAKFRDVITAYDTWYKANKKNLPKTQLHPTASATVKSDLAKSFGVTNYTEKDKLNYVSKIISYYNATIELNGKVNLPKTTQDVLDFLESRHQCMGFIYKVVFEALKKYPPLVKERDTYKLVIPTNIKAGMLVYKNTGDHGGIVASFTLTEDKKDIDKVVIREANWGIGQDANPQGQLPWQRTIGERILYNTTLSKNKSEKDKLSDYTIVKLEL